MSKVLVGKNGYLFLNGKGLENHIISNIPLEKKNNINSQLSNIYNFKNYLIIVYPDKSIYYDQYIPKKLNRFFFDIYKNHFKDRFIDVLSLLKENGINDGYYKTDTHINIKGNYTVYLEFIKKINSLFGFEIISSKENLKVNENVELSSLGLGIGDMTWPDNLKKTIINDKKDNYYYFENKKQLYCTYKIDGNCFKILDYNLVNITNQYIGRFFYMGILYQNVYCIKKMNT